MKLFDYQADAVAVLDQAHATTSKAMVVMASGLGKTVVAAHWVRGILRRYSDYRILILCHNNDILEQWEREFRQVIRSRKVIMDRYYGNERNGSKGSSIIFASFQSMHRYRRMFDPDEFDVVIVDESHHSQAETYKSTIEYFDSAFVVGFTATPERMDGLDITEIFGEPEYEFPLARAIAERKLTQVEYRLITDNLNQSALRRLAREVVEEGKRVTIKQLNETIFIPARDEEVVRIIKKYQRGGKKTIIFCENIEHAEYVCDLMPGAMTFHSGLRPEFNQRTLRRFRRGTLQTIISVNKFNEGIDVPDAKLVVFLRCTDSRTVFLQQLGRGLRKHKGKRKVTVLDFVANCERLAMVRELRDEIAELSVGLEIDRNSMILDGKGFTFVFGDIQLDVFAVLDRIQLDFYPSIVEASIAAINLGIKSGKCYPVECKKDPRLPVTPYTVYSDEWEGWPVFLGTGTAHRTMKKIHSFKKARSVARKMGIKTRRDYTDRYKGDPKLPSQPWRVYSEDWVSWNEFLGKGKGRGKRKREDLYATCTQASIASQRLKIVTSLEYKRRYIEDSKLPGNPGNFYKNRGWICWSVFLGRGRTEEYENYEEAKTAVRALRIRTSSEYKIKYKKDPKLPCSPWRSYKDKGWLSWSKFLGTVKREKFKRRLVFYRTYEEAKSAVRRLNIATSTEYYRKYREDMLLPSCPKSFYKVQGWIGWQDFLGTVKYPTYEEAKAAARALRINTSDVYRKRYKEDPRLPSHPNGFYGEKGWVSWPAFFEKGFRGKKYDTYEEAKIVIRLLGIRTRKAYLERYREDPKLPSQPSQSYKEKGWLCWGDFTGIVSRRPRRLFYKTYKEAERAVRLLGIKTLDVYRKRYKEDPKLPSDPRRVYKGWPGWPKFLGRK